MDFSLLQKIIELGPSLRLVIARRRPRVEEWEPHPFASHASSIRYSTFEDDGSGGGLLRRQLVIGVCIWAFSMKEFAGAVCHTQQSTALQSASLFVCGQE